MSGPKTNDASSCGGKCDGCEAGHSHTCPDIPTRGWRLTVPAMLTFLLPIASAVMGAMLVGSGPVGQLVGAVAGGAAGVAAAMLIVRLARLGGGESK